MYHAYTHIDTFLKVVHRDKISKKIIHVRIILKLSLECPNTTMYVCTCFYGAYNYPGLVRQVSGFSNVSVSA